MLGEDVKIGEGREALSVERASLPSPNPTPPTPKTFALIESLLSAFPVGWMPIRGVLGMVQKIAFGGGTVMEYGRFSSIIACGGFISTVC